MREPLYILLDGYDTIGIGYIALWGFGAKCRSGWMGDGWSRYPLDSYDYQSTCGAKNGKIFVYHIFAVAATGGNTAAA